MDGLKPVPFRTVKPGCNLVVREMAQDICLDLGDGASGYHGQAAEEFGQIEVVAPVELEEIQRILGLAGAGLQRDRHRGHS